MLADPASDPALETPGPGEAPPLEPPPPVEVPEEISFANANPALVVLSYLWVFCLVPLLTDPNDRAVRWHAVHGLVLVIAEIIGSLAFLFLTAVIRSVMPAAVSDLFAIVRSVLGPAVLVLHAILIFDGLRGRGWRVPLITRYAERILDRDRQEAPR